jgi:hypothetical protein
VAIAGYGTKVLVKGLVNGCNSWVAAAVVRTKCWTGHAGLTGAGAGKIGAGAGGGSLAVGNLGL